MTRIENLKNAFRTGTAHNRLFARRAPLKSTQPTFLCAQPTFLGAQPTFPRARLSETRARLSETRACDASLRSTQPTFPRAQPTFLGARASLRDARRKTFPGTSVLLGLPFRDTLGKFLGVWLSLHKCVLDWATVTSRHALCLPSGPPLSHTRART